MTSTARTEARDAKRETRRSPLMRRRFSALLAVIALSSLAVGGWLLRHWFATGESVAGSHQHAVGKQQISGENGLDPHWNTDAWSATGPPLLWQRDIGRGYSSPILSQEKLILLQRVEDKEVVECFDVQTGSSLWDFGYPTAFDCPVKYSDGSYSTPVVDQEHVYALGAEGKLHCLALDDGSLLWRRNLREDYPAPSSLYGVGTRPLVEGELLIVNIGGCQHDAGIVALDRRSGQTRWTATDHQAGYTMPQAATILGRRYLFVLTEQGLVALEPRSGEVLWTMPFESKVEDAVNATTPVVVGDRIVLSAYTLGCVCLRVLPEGSYEQMWRNRRSLDSHFNTMTCIDGHIYGYSASDRTFRCLDLETGELRWKWSSDVCRGQFVVAGKKFLHLGEYGHLAVTAVNPTACTVEWISADQVLSPPCYSTPALQDGRLYLRNEKKLICLEY